MSGLPDEHLKRDPRGVGETPFSPVPPEPEPLDGEAQTPASLQLPRAVGGWLQAHFHCPYCLNFIESPWPLGGVSTYLGPSLLQCRRCDRLLLSHRREWCDLSAAARAWYVAVSLAYIAVCSAVAFFSTHLACAIVGAPAGWRPAAAAAFWGTAVAGLQICRIARSLRRTQGPARQAHRPWFWSLDLFVPQKVLVGIALCAAALAWLAGIAARP
jgi:hypothetical protein